MASRSTYGATPNQLYRLNQLGMLGIVNAGTVERISQEQADAAIQASGWDGVSAVRTTRKPSSDVAPAR